MTSKGTITINVLITGLGMLSALAAQPQQYTITDLGPAGNAFSLANYVNSYGAVAGSDTASDGTSHSVVWYKNLSWDLTEIINANQPGLLGPNTAAGSVNAFGQVLIGGQTPVTDPNHENFCGYGPENQCAVFLWSGGIATQLPNPMGGTNSGWGAMNNRGEVAGYAETTVQDSECLATAPNGTGPQLFDYEAVLWGPEPGRFRWLEPLPGDTVGIALGMNDLGQVVGISGRCGNTVIPSGTAGPHAVVWDADGRPHDLGSFGGTSNPAILGVGNGAFAINNQGQIAGTSAPPGNLLNQPFLWTPEKHMQHLPLLAGDVVGAGLAMNNWGAVVGASISPGGLASGNPSAVLWPHGPEGGITDLNTFLTASSPFAALFTAFGISDGGQIVGFGLTGAGEVHAFLASPSAGEVAESAGLPADAARRRIALSEQERRLAMGRLGTGR